MYFQPEVSFETGEIIGVEELEVCIDDFESGYLSLNTLKDLKVDYLKFDRGFLTNLENNKKGQSILHNLVNMVKDSSLYAVAEGVETVLQADF